MISKTPVAGEIYKHYKTGDLYIIYCISESGDKENSTLFVTYYSYSPSGTISRLFTRTEADFLAEVAPNVRRFTPISAEDKIQLEIKAQY